MTQQLNLTLPMELHNSSGQPVAVLMDKRSVEELKAERDRLQEEVTRLRGENLDLKRALDAAREGLKEKATITAERDRYLEILFGIFGEDFGFTPEAIADMDKNGVPLQLIIEELEQTSRP
jgi:regulator of replication initiation timing